MDFGGERLCFSTSCENYCYLHPSLTSSVDEKSEAWRGEETCCSTWLSLHNVLFQKEIPEFQTPRLVFCAVEWSIERSASHFPCETLSPVSWLASVGLYLQGYPSWAWRDGDPCFWVTMCSVSLSFKGIGVRPSPMCYMSLAWFSAPLWTCRNRCSTEFWWTGCVTNVR